MENSNQTKIFFKLALAEKFYHSFEQWKQIDKLLSYSGQ